VRTAARQPHRAPSSDGKTWLREPGDGPILEFEQLLKISFADSGSKADIVANLAATRAWVIDENNENLATARAYLEGDSAFPERAALNQLAGRFLTDFYVMVAHWADWASQLVDAWPDDVRDAPFDVAAAEEVSDWPRAWRRSSGGEPTATN
jgi:PadR family transcriptional regulator AphA